MTRSNGLSFKEIKKALIFRRQNSGIKFLEKIFREAISNIISHREYTHGSPDRLIIYRDNVILDNPCTPHYSGRIIPQNLVPYARNPVICHFMIQLGRFEQLGSGVTNIYKYLPLYADGATPIFEEIRDCFRLTLPIKSDIAKLSTKVTPEVIHEVTHEVTPEVIRVLSIIKEDITRIEIMSKLDLKDELNFRERYLKPALEAGFVEMTIPDKPNSRNQKYRLTKKGKLQSKIK